MKRLTRSITVTLRAGKAHELALPVQLDDRSLTVAVLRDDTLAAVLIDRRLSGLSALLTVIIAVAVQPESRRSDSCGR